MDRPEVVVDTPVGKIRLVFTSNGHAYCDGCVSNGDGGVTVNGVLYSASCHLYLKDGKWDVQNHMDLHGSRRDWGSNPRITYNAAQMTAPARRKFKEVCIKAVEDYLKSNPDTGRLAWEADHAADLERASQKVEAAYNALQNARDALAKLEAETYPG